MTRTSPTGHPLTLSARILVARPGERAVLLDRLRQVVVALTDAPAPERRSDLVDAFEGLLADADPSAVWLAVSVLDGELATTVDVRRTVRAIGLDGVAVAFGSGRARTARNWLLPAPRAEVRVVRGAVLVDMEHTARTALATGIQRVARETARRWVRDHDVTLVGWTADHRSLRPLDEQERRTAMTGERGTRSEPDDVIPCVLVPWESTYVLPELSPERSRNERIAALAQFGRCRTGVIGFDCVPITSAETTAMGVSEAFAHNLAAVRHLDRVSTISEAAATEYRGWRGMLASVGQEGPQIMVDLLPAVAPPTTEADLEEARALLTVPDVPMLLCVGSHEPRKNHLALLHAAELLWRDGLIFSLVLVGGRSWNDWRFRDALAAARARNRPVEAVTTVTDRLLWAAYRVAHGVVFPSLNEGYGLPVAEALACGTPVVTSGYGSMAEIAEAGGALLVDPRDDRSIAAAMRRLLTDPAEHARLCAEARARPDSTWDDYAARVWSTLVDHTRTA